MMNPNGATGCRSNVDETKCVGCDVTSPEYLVYMSFIIEHNIDSCQDIIGTNTTMYGSNMDDQCYTLYYNNGTFREVYSDTNKEDH